MNVVAEVGINYAYGPSKERFLNQAMDLIDLASVAGCTHIKFQKRNPDIALPKDKKNLPKQVPWSKKEITYLEYKRDIEFNIEQMQYLFEYAKSKGLTPFASVWDEYSSREMSTISKIVKIPSAKITDLELLKSTKKNFDFRIMSTGMSIQDEIFTAVHILEPQVIMHTNSVYPTPVEDSNLGYINYLKRLFPKKEIGYSNHVYGITPMILSVALGVTWIEFHITHDHNAWGSDQAASLEPVGLFKVTKAIRDSKLALIGDKQRVLYPGEKKKKEMLRG